MAHSNSLKPFLIVLKILLVASILFYLVNTGKLDFTTLRVFIDSPLLLAANIGLWLFASVFINSYRWSCLLEGMDLKLPFHRIVTLNLIGFFFNTIAPGALGGDLVKGFYLFKDQKDGKRTSAMLSILLDRLVGLYCVLVIATGAVLLSFSRFTHNKILSSVALTGVLGFALMSGGLVVLFFSRSPIESNWIYGILKKPYPGFVFLRKIFVSLFYFKKKPIFLVKSICSGLLYQSLYISFFILVTRHMSEANYTAADILAVFPMGFIAAALPISPGGLGVGHLAFEQLLAIVGIANGANIYNCVFLGQSVLNLLGFIPYLFLKKDKNIISYEASKNSCL